MQMIWDKIKMVLMQFAHFQKRNGIKRYGFPLLLTLVVFTIKGYFHTLLGDSSAFLLGSFIIAASAWYGGLKPGIFATLLTGVATYFVCLPEGHLYQVSLSNILLLGTFMIEGLIISIASEARYEMENQKDEFIGFVSHELKNPLATIKGFASLIISSVKNSGDDKLLSRAKEINDQSDRILEMINDLLDITKIEVGKFSYKSELFCMEDLVKEVIVHQRLISKDRTISLNGSSKSAMVADRYRIRQVLINLITNAIKYSPEDKKVLINFRERNNTVEVSIKDYGIGISREDKQKIFDRYYRTIGAQKGRSDGLGLGLFISNQIIKYHHGKIWVRSEPSKGSTFYISLPLQREHHKKVTDRPQNNKQMPHKMMETKFAL